MARRNRLIRPAAETDPSKIFVMSALRRAGSSYGFSIRWILGANNEKDHQANDLPGADDYFEVRLRRLSAAGGFLQADGQTWAPDDHAFVVRPSPYAMIDPPREVADIPGSYPPGERQWLSAVVPTEPVDPTPDNLATASGSLALGVIHLLKHTDRINVASKILGIFRRAILEHATVARIFDTEVALAESAQAAALYLTEAAMQGRPNAYDLGQKVAQLAASVQDGSSNGIFSGGRLIATSAAQGWRHLAALAALAADQAAIQNGLDVRDEAERVRSQLRLRSLQGGRMIDFWANGQTQNPPEADRGKQRIAAHLFGLGLDVGNFSEADILTWRNLPQGSSDAVLIEVQHFAVTHQTSQSPFLTTDSALPRFVTRNVTEGYEPGTSLLSKAGLDSALNTGSSSPPPAPQDAKINYDLTQQWMDADRLSNNLDVGTSVAKAYATGDGRLELLIKRAPATDNNVMGFNVYGVWEGASSSTDRWFSGAEPTDLAALKPWLITRRYSLLRDLTGALPNINGVLHPNLNAELRDPAWHPAMIRTSSVEDRTPESMPSVADRDQPLPYELNAGYAIWSLDLRQGMGSGASASKVGWDPGAPVNTSWNPYYWRFDDTSRPPARARPQRYRFWVTAVDGLDQESSPVPVRTADPDVGEVETFIFSPRHRTTLPPPPKGDRDDIALVLAKDRGQLNVQFSVPREFHLGGYETVGVLPAKIMPETIVATVMIMRRRLVRRVEPTTERPLSIATDDALFSSPPWLASLRSLEREGWTRWRATQTAPPNDGSPVKVSFALDHLAHGFEYRAIVGFSVVERYKPFWQPSVANRTVQSTEKVNGEFRAAKPKYEAESPADGAVAQSPSLAVPNFAPARSAEAAHSIFIWSKPVLPPPSMDRDLVLLRLLANPVEDDGSPKTPEVAAWLAEGLGYAQARVAETAMRRLEFGSNPKPTEDQWEIVRDIISHDLKSSSAHLKQHTLVGFRGLQLLNWTYTPLAKRLPSLPSRSSADVQADATLFRLYAARAPQRANSEQEGALSLKVLDRSANTLFVAEQTVDAALANLLLSGRQPVLVRVEFETGLVAYGTALRFRGKDQTSVNRIDLQFFENVRLPNSKTPGRCWIYLGTPVVDIWNHDFDNTSEFKCFVPIGGGTEEVAVWWIASVSAQEVAAPIEEWPTVFRKLPASVKPAPPLAPRVWSVRSSTEPKLTSSTDQRWRPKKLADASAAFEARLFVAWDEEAFPAGSLIEIDRQFRRVNQARKFRSFSENGKEWKALKFIESSKDGQALRREWVDLAALRWLLGEVVEPDDDAPPPEEPFVSAVSGLDPAHGLTKLDEPAGKLASPALIDYFAHDKISLMDSDFEYRYRIRVAQPVTSEAPPEWRYLRSEWSAFSPFVIPVRPELEVTQLAPARKGHGVNPPVVQFQFRVETADQGASLYRVLLQRRISSWLLSSPGDQGASTISWRDIGSIVDIPAIKGTEALLIDDDLERESAVGALQLSYRLRIIHYLVGEGGEVERLLRTTNNGTIPIAVEVPEPSENPPQDWTVVVPVTLQ